MELSAVRIDIPEGANVIIGQSHFIKTVEDLYEAIVGAVPGVKFGLAFNEASGPCLVRSEGNDEELRHAAIGNALGIGAGHLFVVLIRNAFPIHLLHRIREVPEVCSVFCATANPLEVIVARGEQGRAVLGVIDGSSPKGTESADDIAARKELLRKFGYKR
jgi:adenosine/AMP kinase